MSVQFALLPEDDDDEGLLITHGKDSATFYRISHFDDGIQFAAQEFKFKKPKQATLFSASFFHEEIVVICLC